MQTLVDIMVTSAWQWLVAVLMGSRRRHRRAWRGGWRGRTTGWSWGGDGRGGQMLGVIPNLSTGWWKPVLGMGWRVGMLLKRMAPGVWIGAASGPRGGMRGSTWHWTWSGQVRSRSVWRFTSVWSRWWSWRGHTVRGMEGGCMVLRCEMSPPMKPLLNLTHLETHRSLPRSSWSSFLLAEDLLSHRDIF